MSKLIPVRGPYLPGYPRSLSPEEIKLLLKPSLTRRFSSSTLLAGSMLLSAATGCAQNTSVAAGPPAGQVPGQPGKPATNMSTLKNPKLAREVNLVTSEILDRRAGHGFDAFWSDYTSIIARRELEPNPPVKYPRIPICYGNSYNGLFDIDTAKQATRRLFALYGIDLERGVTIEGEGYEFEADGYNREHGVGFKLLMPEGAFGLMGGQEFEAQDPDDKLDREEMQRLASEISARRIQFFVADAARFPLMDGDQSTPLACYMASVVDYLNWIHGDRHIDLSDVLGKIPGGVPDRGLLELDGRFHPPLPGCDFETKEDLKHWTATKGEIALCDRWPGFQATSLQVTLQPGGEAVYTVPSGKKVLNAPSDDDQYSKKCSDATFGGKVFLADAEEAEVVVHLTLLGTEGRTWTFSKKLPRKVTVAAVEMRAEGPRLGEIKGLKISAESKGPIVLYADTFGVHPVKIEDVE